MTSPRGIVLGTWSISGDWGPSPHESISLMRRAVELGVEWVDTAPIYGHGHADELVARALADGVPLKVATKVGPSFVGDHPVCNLSEAAIRSDLDASLKRLGIERVDLVQAHWPCERGTPIEQTADTLDALVREGKAGAWGLCNHPPTAMQTRPATHQSAYSMIRREVEHDGTLEACAASSVSVLAYETLGRGLLSGAFRSLPRLHARDIRRRDPRFWGTRFYRIARNVELLRQLSERTDVPIPALAVGWVLHRPGVAGAIVGARNASQLAEVVRPVSAEHVRMLDRIANAFSDVSPGRS